MLALMKATTQRAPNTRWRWFGPAEDEARAFLDRGAKRSGAHSSEMVTLVVPGEMGAAELAKFPRKMALRSFIKDQIWQIAGRGRSWVSAGDDPGGCGSR